MSLLFAVAVISRFLKRYPLGDRLRWHAKPETAAPGGALEIHA